MKELTQREFARMGGKARNKALTPERIHQIAVNAGKASGKVRREKASKRRKDQK